MTLIAQCIDWVDSKIDRRNENVTFGLRSLLGLAFVYMGMLMNDDMSVEHIGEGISAIGGAMMTLAALSSNSQIKEFVFHGKSYGEESATVFLMVISLLGVLLWTATGMKIAYSLADNKIQLALFSVIAFGVAAFAPVIAFTCNYLCEKWFNKITLKVRRDQSDKKARNYVIIWGGYLVLGGQVLA